MKIHEYIMDVVVPSYERETACEVYMVGEKDINEDSYVVALWDRKPNGGA